MIIDPARRYILQVIPCTGTGGDCAVWSIKVRKNGISFWLEPLENIPSGYVKIAIENDHL